MIDRWIVSLNAVVDERAGGRRKTHRRKTYSVHAGREKKKKPSTTRTAAGFSPSQNKSVFLYGA